MWGRRHWCARWPGSSPTRRSPRDRARRLRERLRPAPRIPRGDVDAAARLERGRVERVDLGRAETADGTARGHDRRQRRLRRRGEPLGEHGHWAGGNPLYVLAALRTLRVLPAAPGARHGRRQRAGRLARWLVAVANTRTLRERDDDRTRRRTRRRALDVCVVGDVSRAEFLRTFPSVYRRQATSATRRSRCGAARRSPSSRRIPRRRSSCGRAASGWARCPRRSPWCVPGAGGHVTRAYVIAYLTVSVPSMPCWRWFWMSQ